MILQNIKYHALGDQADRLLRLIESLEECLEEKFGGDAEKLRTVRLYMRCFKQFREVSKACFGTKDLDPNYEQLIQEFMGSIRSLGWKNIPLKFHLVEAHAVPFIKMFGEKWPLGPFSEQAMESMHALFNKQVLSQHLPVDQNHPNYGPLLTSLMVRMNGSNI